MTFWLDAQLPPALAKWIESTFGISTVPIRDLGLASAKDPEIFEQARQASAVVMTKDADFVDLADRLGSPPQILWVTCGNTSNARLRDVLGQCLPSAIVQLESGASLIEIADTP